MRLYWLVICMTAGVLSANSQSKKDLPVIISNKALHTFSEPGKQDLFSIQVTGKKIVTGQVFLKILNSTHALIFSDSFPAGDLLYNYDNGEGMTESAKAAIIRKRVELFFSDSCFITPAIGITEPYYGDNSDKAIWTDIRSDRKASGFRYSHGYEGTYGIAYSKKNKKTVLYFYSD